MKNLILILFVGMFSCCSLQAQITAFDGTAFSFIAKDASGQLITSGAANLVIRLKDSPTSTTPLYEANNSLSIPNDGVVSGIIGQGTATVGVFTSIDWAAQDVYLELELNGVTQGTMKFYAVPYAQYAKVADVATSVVDKEIVVVNQANYQTVVVNDNDIVKIDGVINIATYYNIDLASKNGITLMGGGFESNGTYTIDMLSSEQLRVEGVSFKNIDIRADFTTFINCVFENAPIKFGNNTYIGCVFKGTTISLSSEDKILGGLIYGNMGNASVTLGSNVSIENAKIGNCIFSLSSLTSNLSLSNNIISYSEFNEVARAVNNKFDNSIVTVKNIFSNNQCERSQIKNVNSSNDLVITGNSFELSNLSTVGPLIELNCTISGPSKINISGNVFNQHSNSQHISTVGNYISNDLVIMISNNSFTDGSKVIDHQATGTIRTFVSNNISEDFIISPVGNPITPSSNSTIWGVSHGGNNIFINNYDL